MTQSTGSAGGQLLRHAQVRSPTSRAATRTAPVPTAGPVVLPAAATVSGRGRHRRENSTWEKKLNAVALEEPPGGHKQASRASDLWQMVSPPSRSRALASSVRLCLSICLPCLGRLTRIITRIVRALETHRRCSTECPTDTHNHSPLLPRTRQRHPRRTTFSTRSSGLNLEIVGESRR